MKLPRIYLTRRAVAWSAGIVAVLCLGLFGKRLWQLYHENRDDILPIGTFLGAAVVAWAALRQARTARLRHEEQTQADRQRRIIESFSKAAEQLGSDKLEVRLGGIYTMERISREGPGDYWPVMETLTAFVRERARWKEPEENASETIDRSDDTPSWLGGSPIPTDIAAVLSVIGRREKMNREREKKIGWIDLGGTDLRRALLAGSFLGRVRLEKAHLDGADLWEAHLEGADLCDAHLKGARFRKAHLEGARLRDAHLEGARLRDAHLEGADLQYAHLEGASLWDAHLEGANLWDAHLEGAILRGVHLKGADLRYAHLEGADLWEAHLEGASLRDAHLEGARLRDATGLEESQLAVAHGDEETKLPDYVNRPPNWPPPKPE